jgi:hypothetical protein
MIPVATYISETCRLYIAVLFLFSAAGKFLAFQEFERTITEGVNIPPWAGRHVALAVIAAEAFAALLALADGTWAKLGIYLALILLLAFTGFVTAMLAQGRSIRCNCFGKADDRISALDLLRNGFLMTACVYYLCNGPSARSISMVAYPMLLAMATIAFLVSANLKGIVGILRVE